MRTPLLIGSVGVGAAVLVFAMLSSPIPTPNEDLRAGAGEAPDQADDRHRARARLEALKAARGLEGGEAAEPITTEQAYKRLSPKVQQVLDRLPEDKREVKLETYRKAMSRGVLFKRGELARIKGDRAVRSPVWDRLRERNQQQQPPAASEPASAAE